MSEEIEESAELEDLADGEEAGTDETDAITEEMRERRRAALAEVRQWGDPILRSPASPVSDFNSALAAEAERMIALMQNALGIGLAATQVGVMRRLLVFQPGMDAVPSAITNPEIEWVSSDSEEAQEGCLSLPRVIVDVERSLHTRVSGFDLRGEPIVIEASGLEARVLQHEIDHLDGVLILDRTDREQRRGAIKALREGTSFTPEALLEPAEGEADLEADPDAVDGTD